MLELRIERSGGSQSVLGDIFTSISPGDRICLLGPSGVGKTTLLNAIAGLDAQVPESAVIGRSGIRIGYLFQEHRLLPWRTIHQNLVLVGATRQEVDKLLAEVGLTGYGLYLPDQLSLGMARRAALARCLAVRPDLLLLDEPFASLDSQRTQELRTLIRNLLDAYPGMAMICVTHDERDVDSLANRLWYLAGQPAQLQWDDPVSGQMTADSLVRQLQNLC